MNIISLLIIIYWVIWKNHIQEVNCSYNLWWDFFLVQQYEERVTRTSNIKVESTLICQLSYTYVDKYNYLGQSFIITYFVILPSGLQAPEGRVDLINLNCRVFKFQTLTIDQKEYFNKSKHTVASHWTFLFHKIELPRQLYNLGLKFPWQRIHFSAGTVTAILTLKNHKI